MSFERKNWSYNVSQNISRSPDLPRHYLYHSDKDKLSTITTVGYFNDILDAKLDGVANDVRVGHIIWARITKDSTSDFKTVQLEITEISSDNKVTVALFNNATS